MVQNADPGRRADLLAAGLAFARAAAQIRGVLGVSLLGSICSSRQDPKDIDFLITIAADVDLEALAAHGRRLKGRAQQVNRGADIVLVRDGMYIGRICHYRECWPRRACQAHHCGQTPHLNDDLTTLTLRSNVVERPPVTIWPTIRRRAPLPDDVERFLAQFETPANQPLQPASGGKLLTRRLVRW